MEVQAGRVHTDDGCVGVRCEADDATLVLDTNRHEVICMPANTVQVKSWHLEKQGFAQSHLVNTALYSVNSEGDV